MGRNQLEEGKSKYEQGEYEKKDWVRDQALSTVFKRNLGFNNNRVTKNKLDGNTIFSVDTSLQYDPQHGNYLLQHQYTTESISVKKLNGRRR